VDRTEQESTPHDLLHQTGTFIMIQVFYR
jgi:hypothetical protein